MTDERPSFRAELERLEAIVRELEADRLDLDEALTLFEEGIARLKQARALLHTSELTVKRVVEEADGAVRTDDLQH